MSKQYIIEDILIFPGNKIRGQGQFNRYYPGITEKFKLSEKIWVGDIPKILVKRIMGHYHRESSRYKVRYSTGQ